jgi:hypothetical protein
MATEHETPSLADDIVAEAAADRLVVHGALPDRDRPVGEP